MQPDQLRASTTYLQTFKGNPTTKLIVGRRMYVGQLRNFVMTFVSVNLCAGLMIAFLPVGLSVRERAAYHPGGCEFYSS